MAWCVLLTLAARLQGWLSDACIARLRCPLCLCAKWMAKMSRMSRRRPKPWAQLQPAARFAWLRQLLPLRAHR